MLVKKEAKVGSVIQYLRKKGFKVNDKNVSKSEIGREDQSLQLFHQGKLIGDLNLILMDLDKE